MSFNIDLEGMGSRLESLRKNEGESREKFSERIGVSKDSLYAYEKGKMCMGSEVLARIGLLYKDAIPYLLYGDDADAKVVIPELLLNLSELTIEQQRYMLAALNNMKKVYMS